VLVEEQAGGVEAICQPEVVHKEGLHYDRQFANIKFASEHGGHNGDMVPSGDAIGPRFQVVVYVVVMWLHM
jgi:hypothetical protein